MHPIHPTVTGQVGRSIAMVNVLPAKLQWSWMTGATVKSDALTEERKLVSIIHSLIAEMMSCS